MTYTLGTSRGVITKAPLLLIDLDTEEGITGRSYLWCYFPAAMPAIASILGEIERTVKGETVAPVELWAKLTERFALIGVQGIVRMAMSGLDMAAWDALAIALNVPLATFNTIVLIGSSVTMVMAWASLMRRQFGTFRLYMGATILLGFVFLVVKYFEYSAKFEHHLYPSTNNFLAIYFTLTGLHMLHVAGGMAVNAYFWGPGAKLWKTNPAWFTNRVEHSGLFWHFVDLVWIFLFPTLYLL